MSTNAALVCTDEWRGYNKLKGLGYNHHTVNHSHIFRPPGACLIGKNMFQNNFCSYSYINCRKQMENAEAKAETVQGLSFALSR